MMHIMIPKNPFFAFYEGKIVLSSLFLEHKKD